VPDADLATVRDLELGALRIRVHAAPGHTPGSVLLEWRGRLLTGDTLFWGGCGNCRQGGDPGRLADTFLEVFPGLDGGLEVHPGHDYAEANLPFAIDIDPDNGPAAARLAEAREARARREEPRPTTLDEERSMNPFLRVGLPRTRDALRRRGVPFQGVRDAFVALRRLRDAW
jgi:hydroxyacylglutathione hydrolase